MRDFLKKYVLPRKQIIVSIIVFFGILSPLLVGLGSDMSSIDDHYWIKRSDNFITQFSQGNFAKTYQKYHPGTTVMWLSGTSMSAYRYGYERVTGIQYDELNSPFVIENFFRKFPVVLTIAILGLIQFNVLRKIISAKFALAYVFILFYEPFFLGISRFLHLTSLSTMFGITSLVLFFQYLQALKLRYAIYSSILLALAVSTKISLLLYAPGFAIIYIFHLATNFSHIRKNKRLILYLLLPVIFLSSMIITTYIVNPFLWSDPIKFVQKIYNEGIKDTALEDPSQPTVLNSTYLFYLEFLVYRMSPFGIITSALGIISYLLAVFYLLIKRKVAWDIRILTYILLSGVIYYFFLSYPSKSRDRYLIELYPFFIFFSGYFASVIFLKFKYFAIVPILVFAGLSAFNIYRYFPVYSYYHSDLIGGPAGLKNTYNLEPMNRGEYYAQAALYLMDYDPNLNSKTIWMLNAGVADAFKVYYKGTTIKDTSKLKQSSKVDYIVVRNSDYVKVSDYCKLVKSFGPNMSFSRPSVYILDCSEKSLQSLRNKLRRV